MTANVEADGTLDVVRLLFGGAAQELQSTPGQGLSGDLLVTLPDGTIFNYLMKADGTAKGSGLPPGMGVLASWVTLEEYVFDLSGLIVGPGTTISFRTIQEERGKFSSDSLGLEIGGS